MRFRVLVQPEAMGDLLAILDHIAEDSPNNAVQTVGRLESAVQDLGESALHYSLLDRYRTTGVRRRPVGTYNIYYRLTADVVDVLHILHAARDIHQLLDED